MYLKMQIFKINGWNKALQNIIMWELSNKLHKIRSDMRKEQIASLMKKARSEMQRSSDESLLHQIIAIPPNLYEDKHLQILVQMVNKDITIAIAHLGNLVIDRYFNAQMLANIQWKIGNSQNWAWLINAFSQIGFCTFEMFQHSIKRIITKRSNFNLQNALEFLQKSFKLPLLNSFHYLGQNHQLIIALNNHTYDSYDRIPLLVLTIFTTATSQDQKIPENIYMVLGEMRISQMLHHSLMKIQSVHRALAIQIANNFLLSAIQLQTIRIRILELAFTEKERVKLEISYYLKGFAENASQDLILSHIKRHKLLQILQAFSKISSPNPKYDQEISQNGMQSLNIIFQKFNNSTNTKAFESRQNGQILTNVEKMLDESEVQTIYEQESRVMMQ